MSKLVKITVILAIAAVAIAAKQLSPTPTGTPPWLPPAASVSPAELMQRAGPLPETEVASYF
jgi:hypothetical protein